MLARLDHGSKLSSPLLYTMTKLVKLTHFAKVKYVYLRFLLTYILPFATMNLFCWECRGSSAYTYMLYGIVLHCTLNDTIIIFSQRNPVRRHVSLFNCQQSELSRVRMKFLNATSSILQRQQNFRYLMVTCLIFHAIQVLHYSKSMLCWMCIMSLRRHEIKHKIVPYLLVQLTLGVISLNHFYYIHVHFLYKFKTNDPGKMHCLK